MAPIPGMTYERALQALADDAARAHSRWQETIKIVRDRGEEYEGGASFYYAFAAKRALIVALSGQYEEGVDPGMETVRRAEAMIEQSREYRPERWT